MLPTASWGFGVLPPLRRPSEGRTLFGDPIMSNTAAAFVCATLLWVVCIGVAVYGPLKRPAGEAWVVTASEKNPHHPTLVRANVRFDTAGASASVAR